MNLVTFDNLDGVPIYYARQPVASYGTKGKGPRTVRLEADFKKQFEICLSCLWSACPWGKPEALVSGGCYVEKAGRHGEGRAIDIDAIWWKGQPPLITKRAPDDAVRYLAVEAILRQHIGMVLDFWYNQAHEDHWHCDNGTPVGYRAGSRAQGLFVQAALTEVHGIYVDRDGIVGKDTKEALKLVLGTDGHTCEDLSKSWMGFLEQTAKAAFSKI